MLARAERSRRRFDRIFRSGALGAAGAAIVFVAGPAWAGIFTPVAQLRVVNSETTDQTTGFTCLDGGTGGPPLPACPIDLGTFMTQDTKTAPGFALFDELVTTAGGSSTQTSSITTASVSATGADQSNGSAAELTDPCCLFVLQSVTPSTDNDFAVTVDLDVPTDYTFQASGWVEHPDPNFPVVGAASLDIGFDGPSGSIATMHASFDPGCSVSPSFGVCRVEPTPIALSGTLPAGTYVINVHLETSASGNWLPSTGTINGFASGAYDVTLALLPGTPVPVLGPAGVGALATLLASVGCWAGRRNR